LNAGPATSEAVLLVVASEAAVRYAEEGGKRAMTRDALCACLLSKLAPEAAFASPLVLRLALSEILGELAKAEAWLGVLAARGGLAWDSFVSAALASLIEVRRMAWFGPLTTEDQVAQDSRARVLLASASALDAKLGRVGLLDPSAREEVVTRAVGSASTEAVVAALGARRILATGIASWWPADLALWRALDARLSLAGGQAKIELATFDRRLDAERAPDPLGRLIDAVAEALDDAPETRPIAAVLGDFTFSGELGAEATSRVEVRQADAKEAEARAILEAVEHAFSAGASPEEIAVVVPEASHLGPAVARLLGEARIPVHSAFETTRRRGGLIAAALEALTVAEQGLPRLGMAALLRSPYLDARALLALKDEALARATLDQLAHILEMTPTAAGKDPGDTLAKTVLSFEAGESRRHSVAELTKLAALLRRVAEPFLRMLEGVSLEEHVAHAQSLFRKLGLEARPSPRLRGYLAQDAAIQGIAQAELEAFARDARGAALLSATLDALTAGIRLLGIGGGSLRAFRIDLDRELSFRSEICEAGAAGAVRIGILRDLPVRPLALLVFADAHEASLDPIPGGMGLFDPRVRERLTERIEPTLRASGIAARAADRVRLACLADRAAHVIITYSTRDEEGGLAPPHSFVAWLEREKVKKTLWRSKVLVDRPLTPHEERLSRIASTPAEAQAINPMAVERARAETAREAAFGLPARSLEQTETRLAMSPEVQAIMSRETGGGATAMSVTALERFGACLFQGFAAQVLRARKRVPQGEIVDPREEGTLLHGALAAAFDATRELWAVRPRDAARIRVLARETATSLLDRGGAASLFRRAAKDEIVESVMKVVEWSLSDETWDFSRAESRFGIGTESWETVVLTDGPTTLRLRGSTDRVDVAHDSARLRVIDYKRGEEGARRLTQELGETSFQLAVYAQAASIALGVPAAPGVYLPTRRLARSFMWKDAASAWDKAHVREGEVPRFARRALDLVDRARHGDVEARPKSPETCRVCDFDGVCRKPRFVIVSALEDGQEESRDG
jgi:ATP-dependent helicase/nuclease subunit B